MSNRARKKKITGMKKRRKLVVIPLRRTKKLGEITKHGSRDV